MKISSFSTCSNGLRGSSPDALFPRKENLPIWNRISVSISASKKCEQLVRMRFQLQMRHDLQVVVCSQKKDLNVVAGSFMDDIYNALAQRLVPTAAAASNPSFKYIVGLAGPPGAGKTTIASEIAWRVNKLWPGKSRSLDPLLDPPEVAVVIPMDGFHLYRHQLDAMENPEEAHARRGAPWTFDPKLLLKCLKTLRVQSERQQSFVQTSSSVDFLSATIVRTTQDCKGSVYAPSFDHGVGDPLQDNIFVNLHHKVVIVEGNYLLLEEGVWKDISSVFDQKWFIDVNIETAMQRVLKRHISTGKHPDVAKWRVEYNDRPNAELILKSKKNADLIIKSIDF